ncbi:MAG: O-antigen ligase family protein [Phycisphaeraceae bacterium]|nr:O-antigen ligase family protein [Phycisphaeraceae bacterium]
MWGYIFTHLLAAAGVLKGWLDPVFGLMVYYAFASLRPTALWFWAFDQRNATRFSFYVGISTLIGWFMLGLGKWDGLRKAALPMAGLILYLLSGAVAASFCERGSAYAWEALIIQTKIGIMALVTLTVVREPKHVKTLAWVILLSVGYLAYNFNNYYVFSNWNIIVSRGFGGIDNNGVAMTMVASAPLAFFLGIHSRKWWIKGLCFFALACMIHVILFSFSRGGMLGLCIVGASLFTVALATLPKKGVTIAIGIVMVAITLRLAGVEVRERFFSTFVNAEVRDKSAASRFDTWRAAYNCMKDHPIGVGPRAFGRYATEYGLGEGKSVHNLFLQTGADYGVAGMIGLAIFYFSSAWQAIKLSIHPTARRLGWPRYYGSMVSISLIGFLTCSQFIGLESVEIAFMVSLLGLTTAAFVDREAVSARKRREVLPELAEVDLAYARTT